MSLRKWYAKAKDGGGEDDEIEKIFELLQEGEENIVLDEDHKNPILALGNTGSGKTTLVKFIATDNKSLYSKETDPGSYQFIILDKDGDIGSGITSQTLYPFLFVDEENQAAHYDCPGFQDNRSASQEIAASYFIKKVIDFADEIKIALVVNHASVKKGSERDDFMELLAHTATLVKDIDKYKESFAIFATKVENVYGGGSLVPDETLINSIGSFMKSVKEEIQGNVRADHTNAVKLIDIFLTQDTAGKYTKIGIFRRPDEAGPLLDIKLLQDRKPGMKKILYEAIKFTRKDSDDFGHTISATAKLHVNDMVDRIKVNVSAEIDNVVKLLEKYDQDVAEQINKVVDSFAEGSNAATDEVLARDLTSKLTTTFDAITKLKSDVVQAKEIKEIAEAIEVCSKTLKIDTEAAVTNVMRQDHYFEFLQNVKEGLTIGNYSKNFDGIMVTLDATRKTIGKDTETTANSVKERVKVNANKVPSALITCYDDKFESLGIEDLVTEFEKQHKIVIEFVEKIKTSKSAQELSKEITNMVSKSEINSTEVNAASLEIFNYGNYLTVLNIFKKEVVVWSPDWIKPFEGHADYVFKTQKWYNFVQKLYVKLSAYTYFQYRERYDVANIDDWGKDGKPQGIKITKANYTKFLEKINETNEDIKGIDFDDKKNIELNHVLELTIKQKVSSYVDDNGELVIQAVFVKFSDLVNSNGKLKPELSNEETVKIVNINATNTVFIDKDLDAGGEKLHVNVVAPIWEIVGSRTIKLNGRDAEPMEGQAGNATKPSGKGEDGKPGLPGGSGGNFLGIGSQFNTAGNLTIISSGGRGGKGQRGGDGGDGENGENADNDTDRFEYDKYHTSATEWSVITSYRFFGKDGGVGGNGGDGGVGGLGGLPGNIKIIRMDGATDLPATKVDEGSKGEGNEGGSSAKGGKGGKNLTIKKETILGSSTWMDWTREVENTSNYAANGVDGAPDSNEVGVEAPENAETINTAVVINNFESYLRQNLHDRFLQQLLKKFLDQLNHNTNEIYDTKTLADTLINLEAQIHQLSNLLSTDEIIYLYQSIIDRTTEYSKNPQPDEDTKEYKKALKYICTAALSQIQVLKDPFAQNLIIDVTRYLDNVLKDVKILKDLSDKANKLKVVNEAKEKFKGNIEKKIAEAQSFIETVILPEIKNINAQLDDQIDLLIAEVIKLQEEAEQDIEKLKAKKTQLQGFLGLNIMLGAFRVAISFLKPIGGATNLGITISQQIGKSRASTRDIEAIKLEIGKVKEDIEKAKANRPDPELLGDLKKKYSDDTQSLGTIDDAIEAAEERLKALQEYEQNIYDTMVPMLDDMETMLDEVSENLGTQSQVGLDVSKWMVQSTLRDVKSQMKQMTRGFSVEDDIARCIEKLEEAMTAQINLYDRIQSFQEQKNLADYMAIVSTGVDESNPALSATLRTLEVMIRSNLVLDQHKQAVNAVTQNVFPFAHLYLNSTYLAFSVKSEEGLAEVVAEAVKQLELMKANIEKYKTSIGKQDEYITNSLFNSDYDAARPFYVWKNEGTKGLISKLLAGEKVILYTDVRRAHTDKFAIKFNLSEINFKAPSKEIQADINGKLKKFKANMRHLGSSYYRFREGVYIIHCESQSIQYSFEKADDGKPVVTNGVYEKIKNGDLMLSPFAMWEMQLTRAVENEGDFKDLKMFEDQVDLELVGHGNYVTQDLNVGVLNVEQYYKPEPTMLANDKW